jgi:hypothetical protein
MPKQIPFPNSKHFLRDQRQEWQCRQHAMFAQSMASLGLLGAEQALKPVQGGGPTIMMALGILGGITAVYQCLKQWQNPKPWLQDETIQRAADYPMRKQILVAARNMHPQFRKSLKVHNTPDAYYQLLAHVGKHNPVAKSLTN